MDHAQQCSDAPLPLSDLQGILSPQTYAWLKSCQPNDCNPEEEERVDSFQLFDKNDSSSSEEEEERVQEWTSSRFHVDGYGGIQHGESFNTVKEEEDSITVQYILSQSSGGHGDEIWAASRHVANLLADPYQCRQLLQIQNDNNNTQHPLMGLSVLELGAGGGIPSWTALHCHATFVLCTDQPIPHRIQCLAEAALRNVECLQAKHNYESTPNVQVAPHQWGTSVEPLMDTLQTHNAHYFDVVIAADCIYMPDAHKALLTSIYGVLNPKTGIALLPFALHGNAPDSDIWKIVPLARDMGFHVEVLQPQQLTPQALNMDTKRALVHMLRLTRL